MVAYVVAAQEKSNGVGPPIEREHVGTDGGDGAEATGEKNGGAEDDALTSDWASRLQFLMSALRILCMRVSTSLSRHPVQTSGSISASQP